MKRQYPIRILGSGKYLPRAVESGELERQYGLPSGWSVQHSGVATRRHVTFETNSYMGARAAEQAMADAGVTLADIDIILSAGATHDYPIPNGASMIKSQLAGASRYATPTLDLDATCLSFISALDVAARLLDGRPYRRALIVSSEIASVGLDPDDWEVLTLFGDAAAAFVIGYDDRQDESGFIKGLQLNFTDGVGDTMIQGGGTTHWSTPYSARTHSFKMKGKNLIRMAREKIPEFVDRFFDDLPLRLSDVDVVIPHQASKVGLALFQKRFGLPAHRVKQNLSTHGNCIAASIPTLLHDTIVAGEIRRGDRCFLLGTSAGFSIGGVLIQY